MCQVVTMIKNLSVSHPLSDTIKKGCFGKTLNKGLNVFVFCILQSRCVCAP